MPLMNLLIFHEISENILKILLKRRYLNLHNRKMVLIIKSLKKFKDTLKAFNDFKIKQESVRSNVFWYVRVYIFWNCIIYTMQWDKIQMLKKFLLNKTNRTKNALFFLLRAPSHYSFAFNLRFLYELKHKVCLSKTVCGIFHFRFGFNLIKNYVFVQQNAWTLWL